MHAIQGFTVITVKICKVQAVFSLGVKPLPKKSVVCYRLINYFESCNEVNFYKAVDAKQMVVIHSVLFHVTKGHSLDF
jgi:hypothetical protein